MKIVTAAEMRAIDHATSERFGVPLLTLMENAGAAVAEHVVLHYPDAQHIVVFCGKGNNGGDGFVAARHLHQKGKSVQVILLADRVDLHGDAAEMFGKLSLSPIVVHSSEDLNGEQVRLALPADLYLDAILGTGFKPPVSGLYADAIAIMNSNPVPVVAVDIPSGADADAMGPQQGIIARADSIITFTAPRPAHVFGSLTKGPTCVAEIGSPPEAIVSSLQLNLITASRLRVAHRAASRGIEQRQLWARAGGRRIERQSGLGGYVGNCCVTRGSGTGHSGDRRIGVTHGCRISSRVNDRASGRNRRGHDRCQCNRAHRELDEREDGSGDRPGNFSVPRNI